MSAIRVRRLLPLLATPASVRRCGALLRRIWTEKRGVPRSESARAELEHLLMRLMAGGGVRMAARVVDTARIDCRPLTVLEKKGPARAWKLEDPARNVELTIRIHSNRLFRSSSVMVRELARPLSAREQSRKRVQDAFYERYMAAGRRAYGKKPARLSSTDRLVLLVGELEADVNNGGFDQYLHNKGRRRANAAHTALLAIGAKRTADLLAKAAAPSVTPAGLARLDDRFYEVQEDLAILAMRHVERSG